MLTILCLVEYLIGGILSAKILYRLATGKDIRDHGSGNPGASNIWALLGWRYGLPTLLFDAAKVILGFLGARLLGLTFDQAFLIGGFGTVGHCFPAQDKFRGGKGIACSLGMAIGSSIYLGISALPVVIIGLLAFAAMMISTRIVSVSSLAMVTAVSVSCWIGQAPHLVSLIVTILSVVIIVRHESNIARLFAGQERKFGPRT